MFEVCVVMNQVLRDEPSLAVRSSVKGRKFAGHRLALFSVDKEVIPTTCLERCFLVHIYLVAVVVYTRCNIISHLIGLNMVVTCLAGGFQP